MASIFDFLNQGWVGAFLGVLGVVFGVYQIRRRTGPRLNYQFSGQRLIESGGGLLPSHVTVAYEGMEVPRVALTQIVIWNSGQTPVRGEDVVSEDPIRFSVKGDGEILEAEITKFTRDANASAVLVDNKDRKTLRYTFSFLDREDGALIRILHTGARTEPECHGTIVGLPTGIEFNGRIPVWATRRPLRPRADSSKFVDGITATVNDIYRMRRPIFVLAGTGGIGLLFVAMFPETLTLFGVAVGTIERIPMAVIGILYGLFPWMLLWIERRRFPILLMPDELADIRDESESEDTTARQST